MFLTTYEPRSVLDHAALVDRWLAQPRERSKASSWTPAVDISEYSDRFVLVADIPGVAPETIDIAVDQNILTVSGERVTALPDEKTVTAEGAADQQNAREAQANGAQAHRRERFSGKFSRHFKLPETVDMDAVNARGEHGVLVINIPKAAAIQPRKITVQS